MVKSAICELLGIQYPVFQGGMAWIADGKLAAAVSNGGGLGIIGAGNAPGSYVREQIRAARALTDKPIGVNIMLMSPFADQVAAVVVEEQVPVVTTGAGNPSKYMKAWKEAGIRVIPVVASVAMAKRMTRLGASATRPPPRPSAPSATAACTWKNMCIPPGTWSCKFWRTNTVTRSAWGSGTAPSSGGTRS